MPERIIGRASELAAATTFLGELPGGPAALIYTGEAGIGKTILWRSAADRATRLGFRLLSARPAETEAKLAYATLADLLGPVADELLPELPEPQRRALAVALLREPPGPRRLDRRAVGAATTSALRLLAVAGPLVAAIDDVQWVDLPSTRVLEFALRRLGEAPVGLLPRSVPRTALRLRSSPSSSSFPPTA
jgi:AAA ATPase domain